MDKYKNKTNSELLAEIERLEKLNAGLKVQNNERLLTKADDSEEKYKALYENAPLSYQSLTEDGTFIDVNPRWLFVMGYQREEVIGQLFFDFLHPESRHKAEQEIFPEFKKCGLITGVEFKMRHKQGHYIDISYEGCAGYNPDGSFKQTYCVFQDITERKLAENKLRISEEQFRVLYNNSPDMYVSVSPDDATILLCNDTLLKKLGYSKEEIIGAPIYNLYHEDCLEDVKEVFRQFVKTGDVTNKELIVRRKNGSKIDVSLNVYGVRDKDGKIQYSMSSWRDITEQKQSISALKESETFNREIVDHSFDCIKILDLDGNLEFMSKGGIKLLEIDNVQDYIGKSWFDLFTDEERGLAIDAVKKARAGGVGRLKSYIPTEKGKPMWWDAQVTPVADETGQISSILAISRDITEQKIAEERVRFQANLLETVEQAVIATNPKGIINYWNPFAEKLYGWSAEEVIGRNIFEVTTPQLSQDQIAAIISQIEAGKSSSGEYLVSNREGNIFPAFISNSSIVDSEGKVITLIGISTDITERKEAEKAINESEAKFTSIYEQSPIAIQTYDMDGRLLRINKKTLDLFGLDDEKYVLGFNLWEDPNISPEKSEALKKGESIFISSSFDFETNRNDVWFPTNRKGVIYLDMYVVPLKHENENSGFLVQIVEITERKLAELARIESEEKFKMSFHSNPVPQSILTLEGVFVETNSAFEKLIGFSREEIIGKTSADLGLFSVEERNKLAAHASASGGSIHNANAKFKIRDGSLRDILYSVESIVLNGVPHRLSMGVDVTEQEKAKLALQESEEKFRTFSQISPVGIFVTDVAGKTIYWNDKLDEITGMPISEGKGAGWVESIHPDDREMVFKEWYKSTESRSKFDLTYRFKNKSGRITWAIGQAVAMHDKNGELIGFVGSIVDITEMKHAEELIIKNKNRLDYALSVIATGAWELDLIDRGSWRSFNHDKIFGYTEPLAEWTYDMFLEHVLPEDREMVDEKFQKAVSTKTDWNFECRINRKDGAVRWIFGSGNHEPGRSKESTRMFGIVQDITERKQAEDELYESLEREQVQANIVRNSPLAIAYGYPDGKLGSCNKAFSDLTGYSKKELETINWNETLTPSKWSDIEARELEKLSFTNNNIRYEKEYLHKSGRIIPVELVVTAKFDEHKNVVHFIGFINDITDRKQAEEELKRHRNNLEDLIQARTQELQKANDELTRYAKLFEGREFRIKELRDKVRELATQLEMKK